MIIKSAAWNFDAFYNSKHPEYVAIRNLVAQNPQHEFILVGHGKHYENFRLGKTLFYNFGSGNKLRYLFSLSMNFLLPLVYRPSVLVGMGGINLVPMALASILNRTKFIPTIVIDLWYSIPNVPKPINKTLKLLLRASFKASYVCLAISQSIRKELMYEYKVNSQRIVVYKYMISNIFNPYVPKDLRIQLNPNGPVVLTVCRFSPQKGLEYLVEASLAVVKKIPNVKFIIRSYSSEPEYKKKILTLISANHLDDHYKIIEEFSSYEEIPRYMVASDVFVLPSISEGLAMVVLEAMTCGLPVISTRVGGAPDVIINNYNGLLIESKNADSLAKAMLSVLLDDAARKRLSNGALVTARRINENEFQTLLSKFIFS